MRRASQWISAACAVQGRDHDDEPNAKNRTVKKVTGFGNFISNAVQPLARDERRRHLSDMFNDRSDPLTLLRTRRSGKPRDLVAPGPDADQLRMILDVALRTPDHGKLAPWRFVIVTAEQRGLLGALLEKEFRTENPDATASQIEALHQFAHQAPTLVVVLSSPKIAKIAVWEQELSVGAAIMNLLHGAHASGFAGGWLTGWPAYNSAVRDAFGTAQERIAGFVFIGTPERPLQERPRPDYDKTVSVWEI